MQIRVQLTISKKAMEALMKDCEAKDRKPHYFITRLIEEKYGRNDEG